jgi:hypothetical protein
LTNKTVARPLEGVQGRTVLHVDSGSPVA